MVTPVLEVVRAIFLMKVFSFRSKKTLLWLEMATVIECVAVLDILKDRKEITTEEFNTMEKQADKLKSNPSLKQKHNSGPLLLRYSQLPVS